MDEVRRWLYYIAIVVQPDSSAHQDTTMRAIFLALLFLFVPGIGSAQQNAFLNVIPQPEYYAWWLRTEYHPFGTEVRGLPVSRIRANWCKANEFRKDLFPQDLAQSFDGSELSFAVDGFFDGSKTKQTALTGVYETCKGERGAFLLVLALPRDKPPVVRLLREIPGEHEFAMVAAVDASTVAFFHCMECDNVSKFKWDRAKKRFVLLPAEDGE
jgi:hypothetical protein